MALGFTFFGVCFIKICIGNCKSAKLGEHHVDDGCCNEGKEADWKPHIWFYLRYGEFEYVFWFIIALFLILRFFDDFCWICNLYFIFYLLFLNLFGVYFVFEILNAPNDHDRHRHDESSDCIINVALIWNSHHNFIQHRSWKYRCNADDDIGVSHRKPYALLLYIIWNQRHTNTNSPCTTSRYSQDVIRQQGIKTWKQCNSQPC